MMKHIDEEYLKCCLQSGECTTIKIMESDTTNIVVDIQATYCSTGNKHFSNKERGTENVFQSNSTPVKNSTNKFQQEGTKIILDPTRLSRDSSFVTLLKSKHGQIRVPARLMPLVKRCKKAIDICNIVNAEKQADEPKVFLEAFDHKNKSPKIFKLHNDCNRKNLKYKPSVSIVRSSTQVFDAKTMKPRLSYSKDFIQKSVEHSQPDGVSRKSYGTLKQVFGASAKKHKAYTSTFDEQFRRMRKRLDSDTDTPNTLAPTAATSNLDINFCELSSQPGRANPISNGSSMQAFVANAKEAKVFNNQLGKRIPRLRNQLDEDAINPSALQARPAANNLDKNLCRLSDDANRVNPISNGSSMQAFAAKAKGVKVFNNQLGKRFPRLRNQLDGDAINPSALEAKAVASNLDIKLYELSNKIDRVNPISNGSSMQASAGKTKKLKVPKQKLGKQFPRLRNQLDGESINPSVLPARATANNLDKNFCKLSDDADGVNPISNGSSKQASAAKAKGVKVFNNQLGKRFPRLRNQLDGDAINPSALEAKAVASNLDIKLYELSNKIDRVNPISNGSSMQAFAANAKQLKASLQKLGKRFPRLHNQLDGDAINPSALQARAAANNLDKNLFELSGDADRESPIIHGSSMQAFDTNAKESKVSDDKLNIPFRELRNQFEEDTFTLHRNSLNDSDGSFTKPRASPSKLDIKFGELCSQRDAFSPTSKENTVNVFNAKIMETRPFLSKLDMKLRELWSQSDGISPTSRKSSMQSFDTSVIEPTVSVSDLDLQLRELHSQLNRVKYELSPRQSATCILLSELQSRCARVKTAVNDTLQAINNDKIKVPDEIHKHTIGNLAKAVESLREDMWLFQSYLQGSETSVPSKLCKYIVDSDGMSTDEFSESDSLKEIYKNEQHCQATSELQTYSINSDDACSAAESKIEHQANVTMIMAGRESNSALENETVMETTIIEVMDKNLEEVACDNDLEVPMPIKTTATMVDNNTQTNFSCIFPKFRYLTDTEAKRAVKEVRSSDSNANAKIPSISTSFKIEKKELNTSLRGTQTLHSICKGASKKEKHAVTTLDVGHELYRKLRDCVSLIPGYQRRGIQLNKTEHVTDATTSEIKIPSLKKTALASACCNIQYAPVFDRNIIDEVKKLIGTSDPLYISILVKDGLTDLAHISVTILEEKLFLGCFYSTRDALLQAREEGMCEDFIVYFLTEGVESNEPMNL